jgi:hypothetical protein
LLIGLLTPSRSGSSGSPSGGRLEADELSNECVVPRIRISSLRPQQAIQRAFRFIRRRRRRAWDDAKLDQSRARNVDQERSHRLPARREIGESLPHERAAGQLDGAGPGHSLADGGQEQLQFRTIGFATHAWNLACGEWGGPAPKT